MTDIVDRLLTQHERGVLDLPEDHVFVGWRDAAIEIERLNAEIARLQEALQHYTCKCEPDGCESGNRGDVTCGSTARAALAEEEKKP